MKIVTVGRLIEEKNQSTLLQALAFIERTDSEPGLTLIGGGPMRETLEAVARRCGVSGRVKFAGWLARESVYELLHVADLFVMPSFSEGFCNAAVEAMAAGCPLICSNIPALREVVGSEGVFVSPDAPSDWAEAIAGFADTSVDDRTARGASLRRRAEDHFSLQQTVDAHRQLYAELLAS